jgi:hypothetical protein
LATRYVIGRKHFLVADDRVHDGRDALPAGVGMSESEAVSNLVQKNAANIGDCRAMRDELERTAIGIEDGRPIKERVSLDHVRAGHRIVSYRQRARPEGSAENTVGEHDRVYAVGGRDRGLGIKNICDAHALEGLIPHVGDGLNGIVPGSIAVLKRPPGATKAKLQD